MLILLYILLFFNSDAVSDIPKASAKSQSHYLRVNLDSSFNPILMSMYVVNKDTSIGGAYLRADEIAGNDRDRNGNAISDKDAAAHAFEWRNLTAGEYELVLFTNFGWIQAYSFKLSADTVFKFPVKHQLNGSDLLTREALESADTIKINFNAYGCFHFYEEEMRIFRNAGESIFTLQLIRQPPRLDDNSVNPDTTYYQAESSIVSEIHEMFLVSFNRLTDPGNVYSTSHQEMYIHAGDRNFYFTDTGNPDWDLYAKFRLKYTRLSEW